MSREGQLRRKNERLRELFYMLSGRIREKLIELHCELNEIKDPEKYSFLIAKATAEIFNLVNCNEKEFYPNDEDILLDNVNLDIDKP
jgi:hypothetical protein